MSTTPVTLDMSKAQPINQASPQVTLDLSKDTLNKRSC